MMAGAGCIYVGRSEPDCEDEMVEEQLDKCPLLGCQRRNWHRGDCSTKPDVEPTARVSCCQHYRYSSATVLDIKFCLCRSCGHRWQEFPIVVAWI